MMFTIVNSMDLIKVVIGYILSKKSLDAESHCEYTIILMHDAMTKIVRSMPTRMIARNL